MNERVTWRRKLGQAVAETCAPRRNWRWMLASGGIGAGFGMIAGLHQLGTEPARMTPQVAGTMVRAAAVFLVMGWLAAVGIRFLIRLRRA